MNANEKLYAQNYCILDLYAEPIEKFIFTVECNSDVLGVEVVM